MVVKLFLMTAVMCLGLAAQAATSWAFSGVSNPNYGVAYLCPVGRLVDHPDGLSDRIANVKEANPDAWDLSDTLVDWVEEYGNYEDNMSFANGGGANDFSFEGSIADRFGLLLLDSTDNPTKYMLVTDPKNKWDYVEEEQISWDLSGSSWQPVKASSVPEPTSGLLLFIGLAGIALKRKRNKA